MSPIKFLISVFFLNLSSYKNYLLFKDLKTTKKRIPTIWNNHNDFLVNVRILNKGISERFL